MYCWKYKTPKEFDDIILYSDGQFLKALLFESEKQLPEAEKGKKEYFLETINYLDQYFDHKIPDNIPKYRFDHLTVFQKEVYDVLIGVPYGKTISYGEIAGMIARKRGIKKMSAQAVGNALNKNPICIIVPCHRVIGSDGSLVGYGGGLANKKALLKLEGLDV